MISILLSAAPLVAASYTCTLSARPDFMHPFESKTGTFDGDRPLELRVREFVFKLIPTIVEGEDQLAVWLGTDDDHSAVTTGTPGQAKFYLNMVQGMAFAVGECRSL